MKKLLSMMGLGAVALLPSLAMAAAPAAANGADNAFMMICTALVLFMTVPGVALFYGGLLRSKNVLSMLTQVIVTFALVCVLWILYGYSLAFSEGNAFFGGFSRSEEHTSELQSQSNLVCRLLLEKKKNKNHIY